MHRNISKKHFSSLFKGWGSKCENECPKPENQKYVIQKSCEPSIFESWQPKIPQLKCLDELKDEPSSHTLAGKCWPGMVTSKPSRCITDANAKACQKKNHPKWIAFCPPASKTIQKTPLPPLIDAKVSCKTSKGIMEKKKKPKAQRKVCQLKVPQTDWDHDGVLT
ncbi:hypothetical protein GWI33_000070 [Rhynchophorus ferrugineus]|uniref:Uncharacterized protein n=1 Tax=Rhynchophorus ferrugineus TaxID=354439 RepID=A0A834MLB9_RHYFE|nr:hypothetical protein GWI33_000070 [Rhynchophorus ferrugineus]